MATAKKTIEFTAKNVKAFTGWLKRFSTIDKSLLLEIDQVNSTFTAKTYNEERSVVKMSSIKFDDAGFLVKASIDPKRVKVGLYNISHLTKIMDQFNDVEFSLTVEYQELIGENDTQYAGEKLLLKNKMLKMNVDCTSLNIFKYISDDLFKNTIAAVEAVGTFELSKANIEKINTLNNLDDSDERCMVFKIGDKKTLVSGKSYELVIEENKIKEESSLSIFKDQYATIDVENYDVDLGDDRLVFKSKESDTITVISEAQDK
jgi:hypothetical protein